MSNEYFNPSGSPGTGAAGSSATMRSEFAAVAAGFALLPTMAANGNKIVTVNAGGTALTATAVTSISGIGTIAAQNANNVAITGGTITAITDLAVADGGTGSSTAANARTALAVVGTAELAASSGSALAGFLQSGTGAVSQTVQTKLRYSVNVMDFGATGDGVTNDRPAFVLALAAAASTQSKTLHVPKGTYIISYTGAGELAQLMVVPSGVTIDFEAGSTIKWSYNKLPLFSFINCDGGGFSGRPKFVYTGTTVAAADYTAVQYWGAMGIATCQTGGAYELDAVVMSAGSSNMNWGDPHIESATTGTEGNIIGFGFNIKGLAGDAGYVKNNRIGTMRIYDYQQGVLFSDQQSLIIDRIYSDRRGGTSFTAPGHVVYSTGSSANLLNKDCVIGHIEEGRNTINYPASKVSNGATLALKICDGMRIGSVYTEHEEGLIQSLQACINLHVGDMYWKTDDANVHFSNPINFIGTASNGITNDDIHFGNVTMITRNYQAGIAIGIGGANLNTKITFDNIYIERDMNWASGQASTNGVVDSDGQDVTIRKLTIKPSKAITGNMDAAVEFRANSARNYVEGEVIGQYAKSQLARVSDTPVASGNFASITPIYPTLSEDYLWQDAFVAVASHGGLITRAPIAMQSYDTVAANTDRAITTKLPSRGAYLVFVDVINPARDSGRSGWYLVTWTGQTGTLNNVQQLGADITRGATPTALTCTVSTAGVVTIGWTSASNVFWNPQIGWIKLGSFVT